MRALHSSDVASSLSAIRTAPHPVSGNVPTPLLWRSDNCFRCKHHHCRYWWWPHFKLFSNEHPRKSSTLSNEFVVPLLVCGFPLNSRAFQEIHVLRGIMTRQSAHDDQRKCHPSFSPHRLPRVLRVVPRPVGMLLSLQTRQLQRFPVRR